MRWSNLSHLFLLYFKLLILPAFSFSNILCSIPSKFQISDLINIHNAIILIRSWTSPTCLYNLSQLSVSLLHDSFN
ncbi:hypothetical protein BDR07DRAFT_1410885 [Suillus spraguei]|nr:hypothetical protein BDR07DRAFT_1440625 [Suillus spraguei]KAG2361005.1 hypothetical protein BDR07DRAFT_1410885 [Suillus spraguei]